MDEHTPGPWSVYPETDGTEICAVDMVPRLPIRQIICRPVPGENWIANARLIAAAPDLLAVAQELLRALDGNGKIDKRSQPIGGPTYRSMLKDAIAKATQ